MTEVLVSTQKASLFLLLLSFIVYVMRCKSNKGMIISLSIVLIAELFMFSIESWLWKIDNLDVMRFVWFNTFAWCDMAIVYCISRLHKRDHLSFSFATRSVIYSYLLLSAIQLIAYFDRAVFDTQIIASICQVLIPSISISVILVLFCTVSKDVIKAYIEKREKTHAT